MRFKGTFILLIFCLALGGFLYFYEIKGGEQRQKAKEAENQIWKLESNDIQQINLIYPQEQITVVRSGDDKWKITDPRALDADADEINSIASAAADLRRESVVELTAPELAKFGLDPPQMELGVKTKDGKEYSLRFGKNNPTGSSSYASLSDDSQIFLVANHVANTFNKKLDDLRNHSILSFKRWEADSLSLKSSGGNIRLFKEENRWFFEGKEKWAADSTAVNDVLSALSDGKVKEFFDENPEDYEDLGLAKPLIDVQLTYGEDKAIKHLSIGVQKSRLLKKGQMKSRVGDKASSIDGELYLAKDESRSELFFVDKELIDKLQLSPSELRDKALATFQRWEIDVIKLENTHGSFNLTKTEGEWLLGSAKEKTNWNAVNGILDAMEIDVKEFIDEPANLSTYGLDKPLARIVLEKEGSVMVDCSFGKETEDGIYVQIKGESSIKIADKESYNKVDLGESDFVEESTSDSKDDSAIPSN